MRPKAEAETEPTQGRNGTAEAGMPGAEGRVQGPRGISRVESWIRERIGWEDWATLLPEAVLYAKTQIWWRFWRGSWGGVLPEGHDGNSVAAEVIEGMLMGKCRLALGWTRERFARELERRIRNEVRRLASLKEASKMRSEWDILPPDADDEPQSIFDWLPGAIADPGEEAEGHEEEEWREQVRADFSEYLKENAEARNVFNCLCDGVVKRREIAQRLGMSVGSVTAARKRLERKVEDFKFDRFLMASERKGADRK
jgi:hypothetical protein